MRFHSIKMRGIRPYVGEVSLDLENLDVKVIAVTGPNGAGKSTLVEMLCGAGPYRETATHGKLHQMATARDAYVEVVVENGQRYTIRHTIDAMTGKGESVVMNGDGRPLLDDAKVSSFDRWAKDKFLPKNVYFAGPFAAQLDKGVLSMTSGELAAVVLRAIGCERYETMAESARKRGAAAVQRLEVVQARLTDERDRGLDVAVAAVELDAALRRAALADAELEYAREQLAGAESKAREVEEARQAAEAHVEHRAELERQRVVAVKRIAEIEGQLTTEKGVVSRAADIREAAERLRELDGTVADAKAEVVRLGLMVEASERHLAQAAAAVRECDSRAAAAANVAAKTRKELDDIERRIVNNRAVLLLADEIRAAVAESDRLAKQVDAWKAERENALRDVAEHGANAEALEQEASAARGRLHAANSRCDSARTRLANRKAIEEAVADLERRREAMYVAEDAWGRAEDAVLDARKLSIVGAEQRIEGLRGGLEDIHASDPYGEADGARAIAWSTLERDDAAVRLGAELPARVQAAVDAANQARAAHAEAGRLYAECERVASRATDLDLAQQDLDQAREDATDAGRQVEDAARKAQWERGEAKSAGERVAAILANISRAGDECARLEPTVSRAKHLETAEARIAELEPQLAAVTSRLAEADSASHAARGDATQAAAERDAARANVEQSRATVETARASLRRLEGSRAPVAELAAQLPALDRAEATIAAVEPRLVEVRAEVDRLTEEIDRMGDPPAVPSVPDVAAAAVAVRGAERAARDAAAAPPMREHALQQARESASRIADLEAQRGEVEADVADWKLLADGLGRGGLQAIAIDNAGPELTARTNDLLHSAVGPRWTVSWETTRLDASGKKQVEECHLRVLDTVEGREAPGEAFSPGQRALIELGASLALTSYSCRELGIERPTIVRDESSSGLSPEAAVGYVAMLRRAVDQIGADKCLFVSHNPAMWERADARIVVEDGKVEVRGPTGWPCRLAGPARSQEMAQR